MDDAGHFAVTYSEAREKFLDAARLRGAAIAHYELPQSSGAQGESLSIDTALLGPSDSPALLLLTSGMHGVEGFCGSGCQVALLHDREFARAVDERNVAVLLVHGLNPYGFSHLRRVNEDNVDLNRNFADFSSPLPQNALYAELHPQLVPDVWPPTAENEAALGAFLARHGMPALQAAISGGQYGFPEGLFYGGRRPSWSHERLRALLREHAASRARFAWIDVHSGLGPFGRGEKMFAGRNDAGELARARAWWGEDVTSVFEGSSSSAWLSGSMHMAPYVECGNVEYTGIVLEFGTVPLLEALAALRADQWLHNHPDAHDELRRSIKQAIRAAFYPDDRDWKARVVAQARTAVQAALEHLGSAR